MSDDNPTDDIETTMGDLKACPHCGANLQGDEIPETHRAHFGGRAHYSRIIAIYDPELDQTTHYKCPDCRARIELGAPAKAP